MKRYRLTAAAARSVEDIYTYSLAQWGDEQAESYVRDLDAMFERIAAGYAPKRPVAAEIGVQGSVTRYGRHLIYWRATSQGVAIIAAVLHERMDQIERLHRSSHFWTGDENEP